LVICAALSDQIRAKMTAEVARDLAKTPNNQVAELSDQWVFEPAFPE
jgi:hypothetical protein